MKPNSPRAMAFDAAMAEARHHLAKAQPMAAMPLLQRAHVLAQPDIALHLRVHVLMFQVAWALRDGRELRGQVLRLLLTPIGHLSGRLPLGNTGTSDVSAYQPVALSPDLDRLLKDEKR